MTKVTRAAIAAAALALTAAPAALAHNAGHIMLPDGRCLEIGSFKPVFPGHDGPPLDLIPATPQDEIGTSFAAWRGNTPIAPGPCGAS